MMMEHILSLGPKRRHIIKSLQHSGIFPSGTLMLDFPPALFHVSQLTQDQSQQEILLAASPISLLGKRTAAHKFLTVSLQARK